jgi:hypothetical protein
MFNSDVIELVGLGFSDDVIIDKIRTAEATNFDTSILGLKTLKDAKVSDAIIRIMINAHSAAGSASPATGTNAVANLDPNDPLSPHDPGIYMFLKGPDGAMVLQMLEPSVYSQSKMGGMFATAMTYGIAKTKMKAVVQGAHASVRTADPAVVFYFYLEESAGKSFGGSITPNEFTLLKLEEKKNSRETVTMQMNAFGGSTGTDDKANTGFAYKKLKPGIYQVAPNGQFAPGEYCFFPAGGQAGSMGASRLYAFGIEGAH